MSANLQKPAETCSFLQKAAPVVRVRADVTIVTDPLDFPFAFVAWQTFGFAIVALVVWLGTT